MYFEATENAYFKLQLMRYSRALLSPANFCLTSSRVSLKNELGLDLFRFNNRLYEGRTGLLIHDTVDLSALKERIEKIGGMEMTAKDY